MKLFDPADVCWDVFLWLHRERLCEWSSQPTQCHFLPLQEQQCHTGAQDAQVPAQKNWILISRQPSVEPQSISSNSQSRIFQWRLHPPFVSPQCLTVNTERIKVGCLTAHLARHAPYLPPPPSNTNLVITHSAVPAFGAFGGENNKPTSRGAAEEKYPGGILTGVAEVYTYRGASLFAFLWNNVEEAVTGGHSAPTDPV